MWAKFSVDLSNGATCIAFQTDKQTNKQTNRQTNILANFFEILASNEHDDSRSMLSRQFPVLHCPGLLSIITSQGCFSVEKSHYAISQKIVLPSIPMIGIDMTCYIPFLCA